jgi:hypothetical protein
MALSLYSRILADRDKLTRRLGMARKKKAKRFRAVTAVKELARERVGAPPAGQIVVEKKKKPEKHKPTLGKLLDNFE